LGAEAYRSPLPLSWWEGIKGRGLHEATSLAGENGVKEGNV